jgi:hypothetical protein
MRIMKIFPPGSKNQQRVWTALVEDLKIWDELQNTRLTGFARAIDQELNGAWQFLQDLPGLKELARRKPKELLDAAFRTGNLDEVLALKRALLDAGQDDAWDMARFQFTKRLLDEAFDPKRNQFLPAQFNEAWQAGKGQIRELLADDEVLLKNLEDFAIASETAAKEFAELEPAIGGRELTKIRFMAPTALGTGALAFGLATGDVATASLGGVPLGTSLIAAFGMQRPTGFLRRWLGRTASEATPKLIGRAAQLAAPRDSEGFQP